MAPLQTTHFAVASVDNKDGGKTSKKILQALYDIFSSEGIGYAAFEFSPDAPARLIIKHKADQQPDIDALNAQMAKVSKAEISEVLFKSR